MGFFNPKKYAMCKSIVGIEGFCEEEMTEIHANDEKCGIEFQNKIHKKQNTFLAYNKLKNIEITTETEILEKSKSVIGRAAVGAVVFGPVGAIVGGLSGTGKKEKKKTNIYAIISYDSAGQTKEIVCRLDNSYSSLVDMSKKFFDGVKEKCGIAPQTAIDAPKEL